MLELQYIQDLKKEGDDIVKLIKYPKTSKSNGMFGILKKYLR